VPANAPPPPPPAYYAQPAPYAPARPQGLSIASLITGIVGVLFCSFGFGFLPSLAAVITGHIARRRQPYSRGMWLTGLITGYVGLAISVVTIVVIVIVAVVAIANPDNYSY
jgi:hypothetical protein